MIHFGSPVGTDPHADKKAEKKRKRKDDLHQRALTIAHQEARDGKPYRPLKEIKRELKNPNPTAE